MSTTTSDEPGACALAWRRYFTEFLPSIRGQLLIEELSTLTVCFEIDVVDSQDPPWRIAVEAGRIESVGSDGPEPVCRFGLDVATLLDVVAARCVPAEAFFAKRIELEGDIETGLVLSTVLEPFFRRFAFEA
jgi:hypothetical protein